MVYTLAELADKLDLELRGNGEHTVSALAPLDQAENAQISFLSDAKYQDQLKSSKAGAVVLPEAVAAQFTGNVLISANPYATYAKLAQLFDTTPSCASGGVAASAFVHPSAQLAANVSVAANAVIEAGAILEEGVQVGAGCFVGEGAKLGAGTKLWANVSIYHRVELGKSCLVQANTVIGSDGFGYANEAGQWIKIPQLGTVIVGDGTEIGASVTIDRGALGDTTIGGNVIIDNQVHIAHNCSIGEGTAIAGSTGIAGSTKIGRYCIVGGSVGINGHITICDQVTITGYSMVVKSIDKPGTYSSGMPAQDNRSWRKMTSRMFKIDEMHKRVSALEKQQKQ